MKMKSELNRALCLVSLICVCGIAGAQIPGAIKGVNGKVFKGNIRWKPQAKEYSVVTTGAGGTQTELTLKPSEVADIRVDKPKNLDAALKAVSSGANIAAALPVLEGIVKSYAMMKYDQVAARALAMGYLKQGNAAGAIKACEVVIANDPSAAYVGEMAVPYWQALMKDGKNAKVEALTEQAIKKGGREASAAALIMRGDLLMAKREYRNALKDGYLRVVVLYENVRSVQPEALFKAAKAFDAMQQSPNAEKMRGLLRSKYGSSSYAKQL